MTLKTVIIDDEKRALELLVDYAGKTQDIELVGHFQNAIEGLTFLNHHPVDLLLLDIQMPDINGLELLSSLQTKPMVIFTTAYSEYAVEGFQLDAVDYLLKPIMLPRFLQSVNKAVKQYSLLAQPQNDRGNPDELTSEHGAGSKSDTEYLFIKTDTRWQRLQLSDITYIQACGDYVEIHCLNNKKFLTLQTLTQMIQRLPEHPFVRVHRSTIVHLLHVDVVDKDHLIIDGTDITISKSYRQPLLELLNQWG